MDKNRVRIICNPYKKEIEYQWDNGFQDYVDIEPGESELITEEFTNTAIQSRARKIVEMINKECNKGNVGLEIVFVGSKEDYECLCNVIDTFYGSGNIECSRDKEYYSSAAEVMPKIEDKYADLKSTLEQDPEGEITRLIDKYNDVVKPSIALCIMGLYSSGKSAFINSLVGAEILPSKSKPTTAKVCKIHCGREYKIQFKFDDKECVLKFEGTHYRSINNCGQNIIEMLDAIIEQEGQHDEVFHMNRALDILNKYKNEEHNIGDVIEIWVPFKKIGLPVDEFDFVIYDTPGSNSDSNVDHLKVLKNSLDAQTNALPVFLTEADVIDAKDNNEILSLIENTGSSLDTTNAIIIINKADEKGPGGLDEIKKECQNLRITNWKSTQIFFLSSLLGIASKKNNPDDADEWLNQDMYEFYDEKKEKYVSDKRKLFEFNIIDESKIVELTEYPDNKDTTHLYRNSGLEAVEREIAEYARKYALYNKCQNASDYLQQAIELCMKNIQEAEKELDSKLKEVQGKLDSGKKELCDKLEKKKKDIDIYNTEFQGLMEQRVAQYAKDNNLVEDDKEAKKKLREGLHEEWKKIVEEEKKIKGIKNHSWALQRIQDSVNEQCNGFSNDFAQKTNKDIEGFWKRKSELFKEGCIDIVHGSNALTAHQKEMLKDIVLSTDNIKARRIDINLRWVKGIRKKRFVFWELQSEKLDLGESSVQMIKKFNNTMRSRIVDLERVNNKNFARWADRLVCTLTEQLCEFNSDLEGYSRQITEYREDLCHKEECERMLEESKEYIDGLLDVQGGDDIA